MGDPRAFLSVPREKEPDRPVEARVHDFREVALPLEADALTAQASRCMDCGVPFCHRGCPLGNLIPEWNDHVYRGRWDDAARALHETNNFPEITGRVCPAPCEASCVLNLVDAPVAIKAVERAIADHVRASGFAPRPPAHRGGRRVAVVGSGPAGLAAAQELTRFGHDVTVWERDDRLGGLLRYGIPDFKLDKRVLDERLDQLRAEGVVFRTGVTIGADLELGELRRDFDAVILCAGARKARALEVPGNDLDGVCFAMDFLTQQNRRIAGDILPSGQDILATGKDVVVIGGGDTGSDCVGTAVRQGAKSVLQLELMPKPALTRVPENPWPEWPLVLRTSTSQEEGGARRDWAVSTRAFTGGGGKLQGLSLVRVELRSGRVHELPGTEWNLPCDLALLAMGFVGAESALLGSAGLRAGVRGNVETDERGATHVPGVFAAGDVSRGQSLVVWAIADGRRVARAVHATLEAGARVA